ncbi:hypothetical protein [Dellaglioa algida]|uniref:WxL domain-containing protein n=1 Tax=Dellaglioa algida TaxID=105612 RepID=A0A5C6MA50_9LACO|nr:hypothetical protein [Dellaglioa algida]MDK1716945.1 hypothetical protein [Dellaglioa algida]MDK1719719.1 hypothetical protein [Dellaglioa algida]MDK1721820.1 hypothetical protein [Dellaglioa algida]MDK1723062.1 hypothetical protein [Dellaglioa algida]MDK1724681.1 hypothetical protein [Dellaglioa algida]
MKGNNSSKKRWATTILMTGIILTGMMPAGSIVKAVSRDDSVISTQESSQLANDTKSGFEKITEDADAQKAKEDSSIVTNKETAATEDKNVPVVKEDSSTAKVNKVTAVKAKAAVSATGYTEPTTRAINTDWDTGTDYANSSATAYVSPSGEQGRNDEPVLYFGNSKFAFQPSSFTNNNSYDSISNPSSWVYTDNSPKNPNPIKYYGIIIKDAIPVDRGYAVGLSSPPISTIESAVGRRPSASNKINGYHLYKNRAGTGFKAIMYDTVYKLSYTFEEMYDANGGLYSYFSITNSDTESQSIGAVEGVDTYVDNDAVPVNSLGPGNGFKMVGTAHTLNFSLRDPNTNAKLGGWTNYTAGNVNTSTANPKKILNVANVAQYFNGGVRGTGMENSTAGTNIGIYNIKDPSKTLTGTKSERDSGFVIKTNSNMLAPGETLTNGSYLTYKEVTPSVPPVATVTSPTINAYADQKDALTIKGKVSDVDSTKGRIKLTYEDGSMSSMSDNKYDTTTVGKSIDYSAAIDVSKLKVGSNKIIVAAVDENDFEQDTPVTVTVNLFKLGATPVMQRIKTGETVSTDESKLVTNITIMNSNRHTLIIDSKNPSGKPLNNKVPGFYIQDMTLTDITTSPKEVVNIPVPVNVTDDDTVVENNSAVYAHSFSTTSDAISVLTNKAALDAFILKNSEAKGWMLTTGDESKVSVESTTLTTTSGGNQTATITNADGKKITITITIAGGLKIAAAPDAMNYGATDGVMLPYSSENFNLQRQDNSTAKVSISNMGKQGWNLSAKVSKDLTSGSNTLTGVLEYIDKNNVIKDLDSGSVNVGTSDRTENQDVTWDAKQGIIANLNGANTSLKVGTYTGEITWTLEDAP